MKNPEDKENRAYDTFDYEKDIPLTSRIKKKSFIMKDCKPEYKKPITVIRAAFSYSIIFTLVLLVYLKFEFPFPVLLKAAVSALYIAILTAARSENKKVNFVKDSFLKMMLWLEAPLEILLLFLIGWI